MSRYVIRLGRAHVGGNRWVVYRTGEFARYVAQFATLHDAEQWVLEHGDPV